MPSPLYPLYQQEWHLSALSTTIVFAVYAIGALGAALTVGPISDAIGRKPVLLAGLAIFLMATLACAVASDIGWLTIARFLQAFGAAGPIVPDTFT